ncbi:MAG: FUSC family protein [Bacteroidales bacterium]
MTTSKAKGITLLYRKHIQIHDPVGILAAKTVKTLAAMVVSFFIVKAVHPAFSYQSVFISLMIALAETGSSHRDRQKNMFISVLILTLLSPVAIWTFNNSFWVIAFVFLIVFLLFYANILGQKYIQMNLILCISLISPFSSPVVNHQYFYYAITVLISGIVMFCISFLIFPLRPRVLLNKYLKISLSELQILADNICNKHRSDLSVNATLFSNVHKNIVSYRLIPSNFNIAPQKIGGPFASINRLGGVLERILLNLEELQIIQQNYTKTNPCHELIVFRKKAQKIFIKHFNQWVIDLQNNRVMKNPGVLEYEIELLEKELNRLQEKDISKKHTASWINTRHFLFEIKKVHTEMKKGGDYKQISFQLYNKEQSSRSKKEIWQTIVSEFKLKSISFQQSLKAAIASAITMFIVVQWNISFGYWLVIFVIILVKPTTGLSIRSGIIRVIGTILGVVGTTAIIYWLDQNSIEFNIFFFIIITLTVYTAFVPLLIWRVGLYTSSILLFYTKLYPEISNVAYLRITESIAAAGIAIIFSFFIWPLTSHSQFISNIPKLFESQKEYLQEIVKHFAKGIKSEKTLDPKRLEIETFISQIREHYKDIALEPRRGAFRKTWWHTIFTIQQRILLILNHLANLDKQSDHPQLRIVFQEFPSPYIENYIHAFKIIEEAIRLQKTPSEEINLPKIRNPHRTLSPFHKHAASLQDLDVPNALIINSFTWHLNQLGVELNKTYDLIRKIY